MAHRCVKHFVVSWEPGSLLISRMFVSPAREVVPNRVYEIISPQKPLPECAWLESGNFKSGDEKNESKTRQFHQGQNTLLHCHKRWL